MIPTVFPDERVGACDVRRCRDIDTVLDRLADALYAADEIMGLLRKPGETERPRAAWLERVEPDVLRIYEEVNGIMKRLSP